MFNFIDYVTANKESFVEMNEVKKRKWVVRNNKRKKIFKCVLPDGSDDPDHVLKDGKCVVKDSKMKRMDKIKEKKARKTRAKNKGKQASALRKRERSMRKVK